MIWGPLRRWYAEPDGRGDEIPGKVDAARAAAALDGRRSVLRHGGRRRPAGIGGVVPVGAARLGYGRDRPAPSAARSVGRAPDMARSAQHLLRRSVSFSGADRGRSLAPGAAACLGVAGGGAGNTTRWTAVESTELLAHSGSLPGLRLSSPGTGAAAPERPPGEPARRSPPERAAGATSPAL